MTVAAGRSRSRTAIVSVSDTHGLHRELEVPTGDLLIHAGDFSFSQNSALLISNATLLVDSGADGGSASSRRLGGLSRLLGEFFCKLTGVRGMF
jgi:hypothetical protein